MLTGIFDAEDKVEEEAVPHNSGAELMETALEELGLARDHLTALEEKVEAFAQHFRFLQLEHDEASERVKQLERLLKQHSCFTSEQLLEKTAKAESSLDQWFQMEGEQAYPLFRYREAFVFALTSHPQDLAGTFLVLPLRASRRNSSNVFARCNGCDVESSSGGLLNAAHSRPGHWPQSCSNY